MKITVDYTENTFSEELYVEDAKYLGDHVIRIYFNTKEERVVDFKPFLKQAGHPSIKKYLDESLFRSFTIQHGNLSWNDYELVFPVNDLYENNLMHQPQKTSDH